MANNTLLKSLKRKLIIILALVGVMLISAFGLIACGEDNTAVTDPEYTFTEPKKSGYFSNGGFSYGTADLELNDYPSSSVNGWTKSIDKSAKSSYVNSGAVNVTNDGWKQLASNLYDDADYRNYLENKGVYKLDDVKSAIKASDAHKDDANYTPTDSEIKDYIVTNYIIPLNPGAKDDDNHVYMLNNYGINKDYGLGTAQKLSSTSSISLEKGKIGKISLWLKTQNVDGISPNAGANIRLTNSIKNSTQAEFRVSGIKDTEWTNYVIYVKPDTEFNCSVTLVVGLGYGNGSATDASDFAEGTVYIDNVTYELVEESQFNNASANKLVFGSKEPIEAVGKTLFYDMTYTAPASYFTEIAFENDTTNTNYYDYTKSNIKLDGSYITSKTLVGNESNVETTLDGNLLRLRLSKASYTVKIDNAGAPFTLDGGETALISFKIKNDLRGFGSTQVLLDLMDISGSNEEKRPAIATFDADGETNTYTILVKNNFEAGNSREFYLNFIIGPADVGSVTYNSQFASGLVEISEMLIKIGENPKEDASDYDFYNFYAGMSSASASLYAGLTSDSTQEIADDFSITYAPSNVGEIVTQPTNPSGYIGVEAGNGYIQNGINADVNTRSGKGKNGSYAGLINTKYISEYQTTNPAFPLNKLTDALNHSGDDIQPLMIYNATKDHYGFIGNQITASANSEAKVSVTLRVVDLAKAYIYLVDTSEEDKPVMTFNSFVVNTSIIGNKDAEIKGSDLQFALTVDSSMMNSDGWVTVNFFLSTGVESKNFRLEIWNGGRVANTETASEGFVFVKDIEVVTASAFTLPTRIEDAFSVSGNPLFDEKVSSFEVENGQLIAYQRELTDLEQEFNVEYPDKAVSYLPEYVWAKNNKTVYAVYKSLEVDAVDPYLSLEEDTEEDTENAGCAAGSDPSAFWMSFSSILLAVILVLAIIALFIKNYRRKHRRHKDDAKSHYKIKSRVSVSKKKEEEIFEEETSQPEQTETENVEEEIEETTEQIQENTDDYIYGEVQDFGSDEQATESVETTENVEEVEEETTESNESTEN